MNSPRRIGPYEVISRLDDAGSADVFLGRGKGRDVVLAQVELSPDATKSVRREIARVRALRDKAFASTEDLVGLADEKALVFPKVTGRSLRSVGHQLRERGTRLDRSALWFVGFRLARALETAHRLPGPTSLAHGRLAPEQVVVTFEGEIRLVGLGASAAFEAMRGGRADPFAAPEVKRGGPVTPRANVFSLAAILWWFGSREELPADGAFSSFRAFSRDVPDAVVELLDRALSPRPEDRDVTCKDIASALERLTTGGSSELRFFIEDMRDHLGLEVDTVAEAVVFAPFSLESLATVRPPEEAPPARPKLSPSGTKLGVKRPAGLKTGLKPLRPLGKPPARPGSSPARSSTLQPPGARKSPNTITLGKAGSSSIPPAGRMTVVGLGRPPVTKSPADADDDSTVLMLDEAFAEAFVETSAPPAPVPAPLEPAEEDDEAYEFDIEHIEEDHFEDEEEDDPQDEATVVEEAVEDPRGWDVLPASSRPPQSSSAAIDASRTSMLGLDADEATEGILDAPTEAKGASPMLRDDAPAPPNPRMTQLQFFEDVDRDYLQSGDERPRPKEPEAPASDDSSGSFFGEVADQVPDSDDELTHRIPYRDLKRIAYGEGAPVSDAAPDEPDPSTRRRAGGQAGSVPPPPPPPAGPMAPISSRADIVVAPTPRAKKRSSRAAKKAAKRSPLLFALGVAAIAILAFAAGILVTKYLQRNTPSVPK